MFRSKNFRCWNSDDGQFSITKRSQYVCVSRRHDDRLYWYMQRNIEHWLQAICERKEWSEKCKSNGTRWICWCIFGEGIEKQIVEGDLPIKATHCNITSIIGHNQIIVSRCEAGYASWNVFRSKMGTIYAEHMNRMRCIVQRRKRNVT